MSLVSFPSWGLTIDDLVEREGVYYKKFTNAPFNGKVEGSVVGEFMNGKREGYWLIYWDNGKLSQKGNSGKVRKLVYGKVIGKMDSYNTEVRSRMDGEMYHGFFFGKMEPLIVLTLGRGKTVDW